MVIEFIKMILYGLTGILLVGTISLFIQALVTQPFLIIPVLVGIILVGMVGLGLWWLLEN